MIKTQSRYFPINYINGFSGSWQTIPLLAIAIYSSTKIQHPCYAFHAKMNHYSKQIQINFLDNQSGRPKQKEQSQWSTPLRMAISLVSSHNTAAEILLQPKTFKQIESKGHEQ